MLASALALSAAAQTIKIGELNSYKVFPAFLEPYRKGMELAEDEVNAAGGVAGRKIEIVVRDDNGNPGDAVRVAEELISRERVVMLMGTFASNVGLAVADLAKQRKVLFLASEPLTDKIVWENGNAYTFRLRASTYMQTAMLVPEAAKLGKKRWAIVYPNYEYGQAATATFKRQMSARSGGLEFVEQAVPLGKIEPGPVVQALIDAKPDAIFSSLFGPDLARFVREGQLRGLFKDRPVFNLLGGEPEYLDPLKDEAPIGWWVTGYPWYAIDTPAHKRFRRRLPEAVQRLSRGSARSSATAPSCPRRRRCARPGRPIPAKLLAAMNEPRSRNAVRQGRLPCDRPPVDDGRVRRPHRRARRQGRDGRLALRRRQGFPAARRRSEKAPAAV